MEDDHLVDVSLGELAVHPSDSCGAEITRTRFLPAKLASRFGDPAPLGIRVPLALAPGVPSSRRVFGRRGKATCPAAPLLGPKLGPPALLPCADPALAETATPSSACTSPWFLDPCTEIAEPNPGRIRPTGRSLSDAPCRARTSLALHWKTITGHQDGGTTDTRKGTSPHRERTAFVLPRRFSLATLRVGGFPRNVQTQTSASGRNARTCPGTACGNIGDIDWDNIRNMSHSGSTVTS
ncbi:hypothetical protein EYF80_010771 [Liparis tanakae]|uniref:Uncharacterized protein n=1 Tax=Liparis tanakae TaxID=230148 RepID=A0A4Z2IPE9_9TELE|nr:hypothetical protein EYF80_010771 [Liparis tanakae]